MEPHKMKLADIRAEVARLERREAVAMEEAEAAHDVALEVEFARIAYDAAERAAALAAHLPMDAR